MLLDRRRHISRTGRRTPYRFQSGGKTQIVHGFDEAANLLDALYASRRVQLSFEGVLLFGY